MELLLHDAKGADVGRMLYKIRAARSADALWMLRSDLHQLHRHAAQPSEAARRSNDLLPCFSQWIEARQLTAI